MCSVACLSKGNVSASSFLAPSLLWITSNFNLPLYSTVYILIQLTSNFLTYTQSQVTSIKVCHLFTSHFNLPPYSLWKIFTPNFYLHLIHHVTSFTSNMRLHPIFLCFYLHPLYTYISFEPVCLSTNHLLQYAFQYCFFSSGLAR